MAHLTDMEELISSIISPIVKDYMDEAMSCYMAGAYRGTVVLSFIALFDDLLVKLGELGNVNATAKTVHVEAIRRKDDQEVFESYLIDQLTSKSLISGLDSSFLSTLRTLRNKAAHPSGHRPSPEEARFIFFETINRFLSKPILSTNFLVDAIIDRLGNSNFFPSLMDHDMADVVNDEIKTLHPAALVQLISKLTSAAASSEKKIAQNASYFLIGLARGGISSILDELRGRVLAAKSDDPQYSELIMQLVSANGTIFIGLNQTSISRFKANLGEKISSLTSTLAENSLSHPTQVLKKLSAVMDDTDFVNNFKPELIRLFQKRAHSEFIADMVSKKPILIPIYYTEAVAKAGSNEFDTANTFANALEALDKPLSNMFSNAQAFEIIVSVVKAAERGAWSSKAIASAKFESCKLLKEKCLAYITEDQAGSAQTIATKLASEKNLEEFIATYLR